MDQPLDERVTIRVPKEDLAIIDEAVADKEFGNRSEALRDAIRALIGKYMPKKTEPAKNEGLEWIRTALERSDADITLGQKLVHIGLESYNAMKTGKDIVELYLDRFRKAEGLSFCAPERERDVFSLAIAYEIVKTEPMEELLVYGREPQTIARIKEKNATLGTMAHTMYSEIVADHNVRLIAQRVYDLLGNRVQQYKQREGLIENT